MTYKAQLPPWCIIRPFPNRTYAFAPLGRVFKPFDPPHAPLKKGGESLKFPLFNSDLGGSKSDGEV